MSLGRSEPLDEIEIALRQFQIILCPMDSLDTQLLSCLIIHVPMGDGQWKGFSMIISHNIGM